MQKFSSYFSYIITASILLFLAACNKKLDALAPHNVNFEDQQFATPAGYTKATTGNYSSLVANATTSYESYWFYLSEYRGNNIKFIDNTSSIASTAARDVDAFNFTNSASKDFGYSNAFWFSSYQALLGINTVLKHVKEGETDPVILQAKAENLFLRAVVNFNLVRLYGRPYYQLPETNPGVPLILEPLTSASAPPARATVKDVYAQIIADLSNAIKTFTQKKVNSYAGKYAAYAMLSRVYLYMSGTFDQPATNYAQLAVQAADSVTINGGYNLLQGAAYANYYNSSNQANTETIWAMNNDGNNINYIPRLLMRPVGIYVNYYNTGQAKPSPDLLSLLAAGDLRKNYYATDKYPNNNTDTLSCMKYIYGYAGWSVSFSNAPVHYLRLAEVYLNRAEAKIKTGDNTGALADLNTIHQRAGLAQLTGLSGQALFDAILKERRIELAFEGHNSFDYFRNGLPMIRNYSSFNSNPLTVNATDAKVVLRISQDVMTENGNMTQNDQ